MKKNILATILPALLIFPSFVSAQKKTLDEMPQLQTVSSVNIQRYAGKWYEIARYPNKFQRKCLGNTMVVYSAKTDGKFGVVNQCVMKDGIIGQAAGEAKTTDTTSNAKYEISFVSQSKSFLSGDWKDYWIVDLDENYQYAAVADPMRENLWILSRTPEMKDAVYQNMLRRIEKLGFTPGKLTKTPQNVQVIKGEVIQK